MSYIELKNVKKEYIMGEVKIIAAHNVSFAIEKGEQLANQYHVDKDLVLISFDEKDNVISTKVKQFKITDGKEVYVYQLVPTTTKSIPLNTFRSVDAYLKCTIYRIDSAGQFIKISETRSENTRTLTRDELNDDTKNLWDWFQLKPATGVVTSVHHK